MKLYNIYYKGGQIVGMDDDSYECTTDNPQKWLFEHNKKRMSDGSSNIKDVEYYEDSGKNITDVMNHICPEKLANLTIYKVIHIEDTDEYDLEYVGC